MRQYFHCVGRGLEGYCLGIGLDDHCLSLGLTVSVLCIEIQTVKTQMRRQEDSLSLPSGGLEKTTRTSPSPHTMWVSTVQQDLRHHHLMLPISADMAQNCPLWRICGHMVLHNLTVACQKRRIFKTQWHYQIVFSLSWSWYLTGLVPSKHIQQSIQ